MLHHRLFPYLDADGEGGGAGAPEEKPEEQKVTFDDILNNKEFQAEFDRRMNKGIQTALANERKRLEQLTDDKISEAEKLAKMSDLEKQKYQQEKEAEALKRREAELTKRELMAETKATLAEKNLPVAFASLVDYTNADTVKASIDTLTETYSGAVKAGVEERLKGGKPPKEATNNNADPENMSNEVLAAMRAGF